MANAVNENAFLLMGLRFHPLTMHGVLKKIEDFIIEKQPPRMIFTPTAELIVRAQKDRQLREVYNKSDILTVDSYCVYYAAKMLGKDILEPVSAARIMLNFLPIAHKKGYKIYLLGAREDILVKVESQLKAQYPGINIVGRHNGYFDFANDGEIVADIRGKSPDVLFVAMSSPLKEGFIYKNLSSMNVPVSIGVGGTFDIIAGKCRLAPEWVSKMGLEWLYRLLQEPKRLWKRYLVTNTLFLGLFFRELFKKSED